MPRYTLLYAGDAKKKPAADVATIKALAGITVVSEKDPRVMVVEGPKSVKTAVNKMADWAAGEEQTYTLDLPGPFNQNTSGRKRK